ncbi:TPA: hypothetical protein EYP83_04530 [Candidatus Geothermarchaeota archaeon]|nr:hypothetical protein [Candidatus Geothermarchaeota archaeon]
MKLHDILVAFLILYFIGVYPQVFASSDVSPDFIIASVYQKFYPNAICPYDQVTGYSYITYVNVPFLPLPRGVLFRVELEITARRPLSGEVTYINVPVKPFLRGIGWFLTWETGEIHWEAWYYEYVEIVPPGAHGFMQVVYPTTGYTFYEIYHGVTGSSMEEFPVTDGDEFITVDPGFCR